MLSRQATALEVCELVYGNTDTSWDTLERFYESVAGKQDTIAFLDFAVC